MKVLISTIYITMCVCCFSQDVSLGINLGVNPFTKFNFKHSSDQFTTHNSLAIYSAKQTGTGIIFDENKFFSTIHLGASFRISRKKIGLNIEPQFLAEYMQFSLSSPGPNNVRILSRRGFRIPTYITYHLYNNPLALKINAGVIIGSYQIYDYQRPDLAYYISPNEAHQNSIDWGDRHFYKVFYNNNYFNVEYMLGIGKRIKKIDYNLRYVSALDPKSLDGQRWQLEFHINYFFLNNKEFSTKSFLYEE